MKRLLLLSLAGLALFPSAGGATDAFYINDGSVQAPPDIPPQVDATNFVNNGLFLISAASVLPYDFSNVRNFTNRNIMQGFPGFRFDTASAVSGTRRMAASFFNASPGPNELNASVLGSPYLLVSATNIVNKGLLSIGSSGLLSLKGKNLNLSRSRVLVQGADGSGGSGLSDRYWGLGTNTLAPTNNFRLPTPFSPAHIVTNPYTVPMTNSTSLILPNARTFAFTNTEIDEVGNTQGVIQVVLLGNPNPAISNTVRFFGVNSFTPGMIGVEMRTILTNPVTGLTVTNLIFVTDTYGANTNQELVTNVVGSTFNTLRPANYLVSFFAPPGFSSTNFALPANRTYTPTIFTGSNTLIGQFAAYSVNLAALSPLQAAAPGASTNQPGRIEIEAEQVLDLTRSRIEALNYLTIKATNHVAGMSNATIISPLSEVNLASTNGNLSIQNLFVPSLPRLSGDIFLYSARWTNFVTTATNVFVTNRYNVLMIDARLTTQTKAQIEDLILHSTNAAGPNLPGNLFLADNLDIVRNMLLDAGSVTFGPSSRLNLQQDGNLWSNNAPFLRNLTNFATINGPPFPSPATRFVSNTRGANGGPAPYASIVNHGFIVNEGNIFSANYFENRGNVVANSGVITLQAGTALLAARDNTNTVATNAFFNAPNSEISISGGSVTISNHALRAGRSLSFGATNLLTDGTGTNSGNVWRCFDGFNLLTKPAAGDLLSTTVTNIASPLANIFNLWAGEDRGCSAAGFSNNVAIGRLILDGGQNSLFTFLGTGEANAIYVDNLILKNSATNFDSGTNVTALEIAPNMKIYYAQATWASTGVSVAERINGKNDGRLCWVSSYAGLYSSILRPWPLSTDPATNRINAALANSCSFDSDGDSTPNCNDFTPIPPSPIPSASALSLKVSLTNTPALTAMITWQSPANSTNYLYCKSGVVATNWQLLTNFVSGPVAGAVTVMDKANTPGCYYKVQIDPPQ